MSIAVSAVAERVDRSGGADACWPWRGYINRAGYARVYLPGYRSRRANRVVWALANGEEPPPGLQVAHACHNRACVNPAHLHLATAALNHAEMVEAGREARGERLSRHRDRLVYVAASFWHDGWSVRTVARVFGVPVNTVRRWVREETRREATDAIPDPRRRRPRRRPAEGAIRPGVAARSSPTNPGPQRPSYEPTEHDSPASGRRKDT